MVSHHLLNSNLFFTLLLSQLVATSTSLSSPEINNDSSSSYLKKTLQTFKTIYYPHNQLIVDYLETIVSDVELNLTQPCVQSLDKLKEGLKANAIWAMKFLDASGHGNGGFFNYYIVDLGNYDECLSLSINEQTQSGPVTFDGQYCLAKLHTPPIMDSDITQSNFNGTLIEFLKNSEEQLKLSLPQIGVCLPSTCEPSQIASAINKHAHRNGLTVELGPFCDTKDVYQKPYSTIEKIAFAIIGIFIGLTILGTIVDQGWLSHFSALRNIERLVKQTNNSDKLTLNFINGGKVYYLILSIAGHIWYIMGTLIPPMYMGIYSYNLSHSAILRELSSNCLLFIEIIIFVGGVLTMYTCYQVLEKTRGRLSFIQYIVVRYLRTTPTVIASILLIFIWPRLGSGPLFRELATKQTDNCIKHWWRNLLYINNYQHIFDMCSPATWYLSSDFQLYAISYLPIVLLHRRPKLGLLTCFMYILGSGLYMMYDATQRNLRPLIDMREVTITTINGISDLYFPFHLHVQSYIMGVLAGYAVAIKKEPFSKEIFTIGWIVSVTMGLSTLYFAYVIKFDPNVSRLGELLFIGFHRILVVVGFAWATYAFSFDSGVWLRKFFDWKFFTPISNMSLSIVLIQFVYMFYDLGTKRQPLVFTTYNQLIYGIISLVMCAILGGILHLTVEAPTSNLLASSMRQRKVQSKKSEMKSQMESKIKSEVKNANLNNNNIDGLKSKNEESNHVKQD
ncbi:nose resistant to fluoxetine protein 6 [Tetranychus urticae]|uniref:Nose resistant-to-fluoxetine protein N-terminal domain-containing protein n=1 Tax=Tetranychus urticae TaxID=32264 RepID=T1KEE9_TETUR|nr:nose resistant to fluoxetine protein 6 [Tetranychus urticae]